MTTSASDRVALGSRTRLPTRYGTFDAAAGSDLLRKVEHLVLLSPHGLGGDARPPLVRVQSECVTGEAFGSRRCDCGAQLDQALCLIAAEPGAVIYLRGQEGRGAGLAAKLQAYQLQDAGLDTVDAQLALGLPVDDREYGAAAAILHLLGAISVHLLTNNPRKVEGLQDHGIRVLSTQSVPARATPDNIDYLRAKRDRLGHQGLLPP